MPYDIRIFKNILCNYYSRTHSSTIRYLSPCQILNEYMNDPCSIFNGTIVPTGSMPPIPPVPPFPPGPIGSRGIFTVVGQRLNDGDFYDFTGINVQGTAIEFDPISNSILLAPNKTYEFSWSADTILEGVVPSDLEIDLVLDGVAIPGSADTAINVQPGVPTILQASGRFMTGNAQSILLMGFVTNPPVQGISSANLTIVEVLP